MQLIRYFLRCLFLDYFYYCLKDQVLVKKNHILTPVKHNEALFKAIEIQVLR